MCALDYNISFVFISSFYLSHTYTYSHTHTPLSDVDWATGVPRRYVMWKTEFSFLCESPSGDRRHQAGRTGLLTQQQRVFEYVPGDAAAARIICVNHQTTLNSGDHYLIVCFICFFLHVQSSDAFRLICIRQPRSYSCFCLFHTQRMIKEKTASLLFLSTFCYCFYFLYGWCCIFHVYTLPCPSQQRKIILMYWHSLHLAFSCRNWLCAMIFLNTKQLWYGFTIGLLAMWRHNHLSYSVIPNLRVSRKSGKSGESGN